MYVHICIKVSHAVRIEVMQQKEKERDRNENIKRNKLQALNPRSYIKEVFVRFSKDNLTKENFKSTLLLNCYQKNKRNYYMYLKASLKL